MNFSATSETATAPPSRRRGARLRRWLVGTYLLGVHALVGLLLLYPNGVERGKRYLLHDPSQTEEYRGMVRAQALVSMSLPPNSTVFLGDSRMRDLQVAEVAQEPTINFSIGGDTTRGLLGRLPRYKRLETARRLVIGIGVNDLSHFDDVELLANYRQLLQQFRALGVAVSVTAIIPINETIYRQENATLLTGQHVSNDRIATVNRAIRDLCGSFGAVEFVDTNAALVGPDGNLRPEYTRDGLHLSELGNTIWAKALYERVGKRE